MDRPVIYLDNAASSWPKPPGVAEAMAEAVRDYAANPGRGSHRMAIRAGKTVAETRARLAKLFGIRNPNDVSFALNTTMALNMAIKGWVKPGDHVVCTAVEHNSVRRPLEALRRSSGVEVTYVETDEAGRLNLERLREALGRKTSLVVVGHASNLLGSILPLEDVVRLAHERGAVVLVDAAQTAGSIPIDVEAMGVDMLAFPGHKGLLGPQGTGGLYVRPDLELEPVLHGGTGSQSELPDQPDVRPDRYESGTVNTPGIAGLGEGIRYVLERTPEEIGRHERRLTERMMEGLAGISGLRLLGPAIGEPRVGIVAFVADFAESAEIAFILDQHYGIAVRSGYHCAPLAHRMAGTLETGAVRASVGPFNTEADVDALVAAMHEIARHYRNKGVRDV